MSGVKKKLSGSQKQKIRKEKEYYINSKYAKLDNFSISASSSSCASASGNARELDEQGQAHPGIHKRRICFSDLPPARRAKCLHSITISTSQAALPPTEKRQSTQVCDPPPGVRHCPSQWLVEAPCVKCHFLDEKEADPVERRKKKYSF
ncbi:hypothetical protein TNCV_2207981 [Trichonephila clavipes]|uniref:Uncharacterized protein n=1 Tax=Trichonephila clavipes TaxID=2585209 RepID=A0A8X6S9M9_TRICX|nr:hypothetical protein TNCV_2207981 [Trichonephila clavipes]